MNQKLLLSALTASAVLAAPLITGKILRPDGTPLSGINVQLKSTLENTITDAAGVFNLGNASSSSVLLSSTLSSSSAPQSSVNPLSSQVLSSQIQSSSSGGITAVRPQVAWSLAQVGSKIELHLATPAMVQATLFDARGQVLQNLAKGSYQEELKLSLSPQSGVQYLLLDINGQKSTHRLIQGQLQNSASSAVQIRSEHSALSLPANDSLILYTNGTRMFAVGVSAGVNPIPNIYAVNRAISGSYTGGTPSKLQLSMNSSVQNRLYDIVFGSSPFSLTTWSEWLPGASWTGQILVYNTANQVVGSSGILSFVDSTSRLSFANFAVSSSSVLSSSNSSSSALLSSSSQSCVGQVMPANTICDTRDGRSYKTVKIGTQEWMAENLNYLPTNTNQNGAWCYNNSDVNCSIHGRLYDWSTAMANAPSSINSPSGVQGVCPIGWHLPSSAEWTTLIQYVDANNGTDSVGKSLKAISGLWKPMNGITNTDQFGFSALPAGLFRNSFSAIDSLVVFWSATQYDATTAYLGELFHDLNDFRFFEFSKSYAFSVRCINNIAPSSSSQLSSSVISSSSSLSSSSVLSSSSALSYGSVYDARDGTTYKTVKIGTQEWMAQNLNYGTKVLGANTQSNDAQVEKYCYNDADISCVNYGGLYQWSEMMNLPSSCNSTNCSSQVDPVHQGICPVGWHIPIDAEWDALNTLIGKATAGTQLKSTTGWSGTPGNGSDLYGFSALPAGYLDSFNRLFVNLGSTTYFWSASEWQVVTSGTTPYGLSGSNTTLTPQAGVGKGFGFSVRCIKNIASSSSSSSVISSSSIVSSSSVLSSSSVISSSSASGAISFGSLTDARDSKVYKTVQIGNQVWMAENLNYTPTSGNSWCYSNIYANCATYGRLYDLATTMTLSSTCNSTDCSAQINPIHQGVCPTGWHIPTDMEWKTLEITMGMSSTDADGVGYRGTVSTKLKSIWLWSTGKGTDDFGFSVLPAGHYYDGLFSSLGYGANFWSASLLGQGYAWIRNLYGGAGVNRAPDKGGTGLSVRCIQD